MSTVSILELKFACGHSEERMHGKPALDNVRLKRARLSLCGVSTSARRSEREFLIMQSILHEKERAKLQLTGTKKQIDWAVDIRESWLASLRRELPGHIRQKLETAKTSSSDQAQVMGLEQATTNVLLGRLAAIEDVLAQKRAAWWIDRRDGGLNERINQATENALQVELAFLQSG